MALHRKFLQSPEIRVQGWVTSRSPARMWLRLLELWLLLPAPGKCSPERAGQVLAGKHPPAKEELEVLIEAPQREHSGRITTKEEVNY